jgi:group I intron endonuclease
LQRAFDKYTQDNFIISLIEACDKKDLIKREQYYIDLLKPKYNICPTAGSNLNRIFTEEHKQNLSKSLTGKIRTQEQKENQRNLKLGKTHTTETKEKVSKIVNKIKGSRVGDKITKENILKFVAIANIESSIKTIKQICKENNFNYRSILRFVSNSTWKEYFHLLNENTVSNFKNPSLTKLK